MRQNGGFYIKPKNEKDKEKIFPIVLKFLKETHFEGGNMWMDFLTENLEIEYEIFIDYRDYNRDDGPILVDICKAIVQSLPDVHFEAISHYCNENAGFYEDHIVTYKGDKILDLYSVEYFDGDEGGITCPDCGAPLMVEVWDDELNNIIPTHVYCNDCNQNIEIKSIADRTTIRL